MALAFPLVAVLAKGSIERELQGRAEAALAARGVNGVTVTAANWADLRLVGPADTGDAALAAVAAMPHRRDANRVSFVAAGPSPAPVPASPTSPTGSTGSAPAGPGTTADPAQPTEVQVTAAIEASRITLSGRVASRSQEQRLLTAATTAFGAPNVVDQVTVDQVTVDAGSRPATAAVDRAVGQLAQVVTAFGAQVDQGTVGLRDTTLTVEGTGFSPGAATGANQVLSQARAAGVTVTGQVAEPPVPDPAALQGRLRHLLTRSGINFGTGSATITAASNPVLNTAAQSILQAAAVPITIGGYTDNAGVAAANQALSQRRADAVRTYLVGQGVPASQLTARGFGPARPVASNDTAAGRAANRRIEFTVGS